MQPYFNPTLWMTTKKVQNGRRPKKIKIEDDQNNFGMEDNQN